MEGCEKAGRCADVTDLKDCISRLTVLMEETRSTQNDHEARLRTIENRRGESLEKTIWIVIGIVVAAAAAMIKDFVRGGF